MRRNRCIHTPYWFQSCSAFRILLFFSLLMDSFAQWKYSATVSSIIKSLIKYDSISCEDLPTIPLKYCLRVRAKSEQHAYDWCFPFLLFCSRIFSHFICIKEAEKRPPSYTGNEHEQTIVETIHIQYERRTLWKCNHNLFMNVMK